MDEKPRVQNQSNSGVEDLFRNFRLNPEVKSDSEDYDQGAWSIRGNSNNSKYFSDFSQSVGDINVESKTEARSLFSHSLSPSRFNSELNQKHVSFEIAEEPKGRGAISKLNFNLPASQPEGRVGNTCFESSGVFMRADRMDRRDSNTESFDFLRGLMLE